MRAVKNEDFKMSITFLDPVPNSLGRYFVAVSFYIAVEEHNYPRTCFTDNLTVDEICDVLEAPKDYAYGGGYSNPG
jgi:hypothetical protein